MRGNCWCTVRPLQTKFARLYRLVLKRKITVADLVKDGDWISINWDCLFVRLLRDREVQSLESIKILIAASSIKSGMADRIIWVHEKAHRIACSSGVDHPDFNFDAGWLETINYFKTSRNL
ncbi:hypothetical protein V6N12_054984 [Hibiscus sabdariffa]|uniref:Uncharacterized protein n=1 Tax=Hibiscus sabdariffa TaxID=183260 RepID=A0ABR2D204_9ROSI